MVEDQLSALPDDVPTVDFKCELIFRESMGNDMFRLKLFGSMIEPLFDMNIDFSNESFNVLKMMWMQKDALFILLALVP